MAKFGTPESVEIKSCSVEDICNIAVELAMRPPRHMKYFPINEKNAEQLRKLGVKFATPEDEVDNGTHKYAHFILDEPLDVETPKFHAWQKPKYSWPKKKR